MKKTFRICTWNLHLGIELPLIIDSIKNNTDFTKLDLLGIQEASIHNGRDDTETIANVLGPNFRYLQTNIAKRFGKPQISSIIWNQKKVHFKEIESFLLPKIIYEGVSQPEKIFLKVLGGNQRNCIMFECTFNNKLLRFYVAHLNVLGFRNKRMQANFILSYDNNRKPADLSCIMGDLNTFKFKSRPTWKKVDEDFKKFGYNDLTSDIFWTFRDYRIGRHKLDAIFIKPDNFSYKSWTLNVPGSDHIPVFADIEV